MNYGPINIESIKENAQLICSCIGYGKNGVADLMIIETAIAETGLGEIEDKTPGAGMGITQFDKFPFDDIKKRNMRLQPKILEELGVDIALVEWDDLRYNPFLGLLFARLLYWLKGQEIPISIQDRAAYWKLHYNTRLGKGTVEHYLAMNEKFKID